MHMIYSWPKKFLEIFAIESWFTIKLGLGPNLPKKNSIFHLWNLRPKMLIPFKSSQTPLLLIEDYSCFVCILHQLISTDISTFFIEAIIDKYIEIRATGSNTGSELANLLSLICCLTRLKLFKVKLIIEVLEELISSFTIEDVILIQLVLNSVAFSVGWEIF